MIRDVSGQIIGAQMTSLTDGAPFTGAVTVYVTIDGGAQTLGATGSGACTHEGNGYHTYLPTQAETDGSQIAFTFLASGAVTTTVQVYPFTDLLTASLSQLLAIKTKTDYLPSATAGAAGGVFIAGTNAPVTITGAGDALTLLSTGSSGAGLRATGNGSGSGIEAQSGSGSTGYGIHAQSNADNGYGLRADGSGTGAGVSAKGGLLGSGLEAVGGDIAGSGLYATASAKGHGAHFRGIVPLGGGDDEGHGLRAVGGSNDQNDGIRAVASSGVGVPIRGDITGNLSGTTGDTTNIAAIKVKTDSLPTNPASQDTLTTVQSQVSDIYGFVDTEIAAILEDTGTTLDDLVDDLENRITAALATQMAAHSLGVGRGVVNAGSSNTTVVIKTVNDLTASAVDDFYNGRHIVFTSGALMLQACSITDYVGATKTATVSQLTSVPANDVTFVIV